MLSVQASAAATNPPASLQPPTTNVGMVPPSPRVGSQGEGLDLWFEELRKHEATLSAMATASADPKFREELGTIEQWFKLLSESEQTATLYTLLQHANQGQVKFMAAILGQMSAESANPPAEIGSKIKQGPRSLRPPSLNLPLPGSPATPQFATPATSSLPPDAEKVKSEGQELTVPGSDSNWANEVNTPQVRMFPKSDAANTQSVPTPLQGVPGLNMGMPGMPMLNPFNMAMLNNMGFSQEAQMLAMQMIMNGMVPGQMPGQHGQHRQGNHAKPSGGNNWRAPGSAKYPGSALRTGGLKSSALKSSGLKTAGLKSAGLGSATTPKEDDIDPELLKDVPAWLKSLRLHKYTHCFEGMTWEQMVELDEATLEAKGVAALGARRRLIKTFDAVKRRMGLETAPLDPVPASAALPSTNSTLPRVPVNDLPQVPHSAAPALH